MKVHRDFIGGISASGNNRAVADDPVFSTNANDRIGQGGTGYLVVAPLSQNCRAAIPRINNIIFKDRYFEIFFQVRLTQSPVDVKSFNFKLRNRYISGCVCRRDLLGGNTLINPEPKTWGRSRLGRNSV